MDKLKKLSPQAQVVLGGAVLYVIFSFFNWQQVCGGSADFHVCAGVSEWNGFGGTITALAAIALLAWEIVRVLGMKIELGGISHGLISLGLAGLLLLLTILTFLTHNEARHWPSYIGLLLALVIAGAAFTRGKSEGVQMSDFSAVASSVGSMASGGGDSSASATPAAAPTPPAPEPPSAPTPPAEEPSGGESSEHS